MGFDPQLEDVVLQMLALQGECERAGLCSYVVVDAGRTQIAPGSKTVLGIGPAPVHGARTRS